MSNKKEDELGISGALPSEAPENLVLSEEKYLNVDFRPNFIGLNPEYGHWAEGIPSDILSLVRDFIVLHKRKKLVISKDKSLSNTTNVHGDKLKEALKNQIFTVLDDCIVNNLIPSYLHANTYSKVKYLILTGSILYNPRIGGTADLDIRFIIDNPDNLDILNLDTIKNFSHSLFSNNNKNTTYKNLDIAYQPLLLEYSNPFFERVMLNNFIPWILFPHYIFWSNNLSKDEYLNTKKQAILWFQKTGERKLRQLISSLDNF